MEDDHSSQQERLQLFQSITGADHATAEHVLEAHGWDLNRSVNFFVEAGGMPSAAPATTQAAADDAEQWADAEEDFGFGGEPQEADAAGASRQPPARAEPGADWDDDADLQAALDASVQPEPTGETARARRSAVQVPAPIDLGDDDDDEDEDDDLRFVSAQGPSRAAARSQRQAFAGLQPGFLDGGGRSVRRNRPSGAARPDPDMAALAAAGRAFPSSRPLPLSGASSPLRPTDLAEPPPAFGAAGLGAAGFGVAGFGGVGSNGHLELPEGINVEEARMLEAAMLGVPYEGRLPDFSQPPPAEPVSPSVLRQRELRDEQDAAYQQSLLEDRRKAEAAAAAKRAEAEAEERQRLAEAAAVSAQEHYERQIAAKLEALPLEPPADAPEAVSVAVRTPSGKRFSRRFLRSEPLQTLFDYVDVSAAPDFKPGSFRLVTQFPRRVFERSQAGSLAEAGLAARQEAVFLEPL